MSALPPITTKKADIDYVGFVPKADIERVIRLSPKRVATYRYARH
jgi:hypothetical protein